MDRIRVLVADDEAGVCAALAQLIEDESSFVLVGVARDAQEAIDLAVRERPDVALVDVKMPAGGGRRAAREIKAAYLPTRVIALSAYQDRTTVVEMLRAGAVGYLVKGTPAAEIVKMIRSASRGEAALSSEVMADVLYELTGRLDEETREEELFETQLNRIRTVLEPGSGGLAMVFQPIADLETEGIVGLEALARFPMEPDRPVETWFAEATSVGLRLELELAAIHCAVAAFREAPLGTYLAVNATPETVASGGIADLINGTPGDRLVVEITEYAPVHDYAALNAALKTMRGDGVRLAVDDAGAGYSSLRHILQLEPDFIKIDNTLTRDLYKDPARRALAAGLISFAEELGATIIAEGIERREQLEALRDLGVRYGQGYYIARPGPISAVAQVGELAR
jgi:EAL domain-containing protein (putative c-di-GMP-specific phosphodiesterase class I)/CheY-like chemotaxis protein